MALPKALLELEVFITYNQIRIIQPLTLNSVDQTPPNHPPAKKVILTKASRRDALCVSTWY